MSEALNNYLSHSWEWVRSGGPADPTEYARICDNCGCEDQGSPNEFPDLQYPPCETCERTDL